MVLGTTSGMATASVGMASVTRMATRTNLARATSRLEGMDSQVGPAWRRTRSTRPDIEEVRLHIPVRRYRCPWRDVRCRVVQPPAESLAVRWIDVSVTTEAVPVIRLVGRAVRAIVVDSRLGGANYETSPKVRCRVALERRDDGSELLGFDYTNEPEAGRHAASLRTRLFTSGLWDFCREVGVPFDRIADAVPVDGP